MVETVLKTRFPGVEYFPECRAIGGFPGMVDFAILRERIIIQVDGDYHFERPLKRPLRGGQAEIDTRCNVQAMIEGWHMLRINNADIEDTEHLLNKVRMFSAVCAGACRLNNWSWGSSCTFSKAFGRPAVAFLGGQNVSHWLTA